MRSQSIWPRHGDLGKLMNIAPSILVTLFNRLEADGYLSRQRDPVDRRRHVVNLNPAGDQQLERAAEAQRDAEDELLASLTDSQRGQLRSLLVVLHNELTLEHTAPPCAVPSLARLTATGRRSARTPRAPSARALRHSHPTHLTPSP